MAKTNPFPYTISEKPFLNTPVSRPPWARRYFGSMKQKLRFLDENVKLWKTTFWEAWEPLPIDVKIAWIAFVTQTVAVITVIELFLLKKH